jgi:hypothetical protein
MSPLNLMARDLFGDFTLSSQIFAMSPLDPMDHIHFRTLGFGDLIYQTEKTPQLIPRSWKSVDKCPSTDRQLSALRHSALRESHSSHLIPPGPAISDGSDSPWRSNVGPSPWTI